MLRPAGTLAVIIDTVGNCDRLGGPRTLYEWTLAGVERRSARIEREKAEAAKAAEAAAREVRVAMVTIDDRTVEVRSGQNGAQWHESDVRRAAWGCERLEDWLSLAEQLGYSKTWALIRYRARNAGSRGGAGDGRLAEAAAAAQAWRG